MLQATSDIWYDQFLLQIDPSVIDKKKSFYLMSVEESVKLMFRFY